MELPAGGQKAADSAAAAAHGGWRRGRLQELPRLGERKRRDEPKVTAFFGCGDPRFLWIAISSKESLADASGCWFTSTVRASVPLTGFDPPRL